MAACSSPKSGDTTPSEVAGDAVTTLADYDSQAMRGQSLRLKGFLFLHTGGEKEYELCETQCESFPPQCCGKSVVLSGVDAEQAAAHLDSQSNDGAMGWSNDTIVCSGDASDSGFAVTSIDAAKSDAGGDVVAPAEPAQPAQSADPTTDAQCWSDEDCEDGKSCQLVAACDTCDGGTHQCVGK